MTYLVDSHCHVSDLALEGKKAGLSVADIVARAHHCGVTHMLSVACLPQDFPHLMEVAGPYPEIFLACGAHPLNLSATVGWDEGELISCLRSSPRVIALGETGLDYHYALETRRIQLESFHRQVGIAKDLRLPLIVHAREAPRDTVAVLTEEGARDCGGVMHCFTDTIDMARKCLDLGFYISFSGIATFKASGNVRETLRYVPLDRMLVETDCPYLAPIPVRGIENEPAFVRYTLDFIAREKGVSPKGLAALTSRNFEDLFKVSLDAAQPTPDAPGAACPGYALEGIMDLPLGA